MQRNKRSARNGQLWLAASGRGKTVTRCVSLRSTGSACVSWVGQDRERAGLGRRHLRLVAGCGGIVIPGIGLGRAFTAVGPEGWRWR